MASGWGKSVGRGGRVTLTKVDILGPQTPWCSWMGARSGNRPGLG